MRQSIGIHIAWESCGSQTTWFHPCTRRRLGFCLTSLSPPIFNGLPTDMGTRCHLALVICSPCHPTTFFSQFWEGGVIASWSALPSPISLSLMFPCRISRSHSSWRWSRWMAKMRPKVVQWNLAHFMLTLDRSSHLRVKRRPYLISQRCYLFLVSSISS